MKYMKKKMIMGILSLLLILLTGCNGSGGKKKVLSISHLPETTEMNYYNRKMHGMFIADYYRKPSQILDENTFDVEHVYWEKAAKKLKNISDYDALIIWESPSEVKDSRGNDPLHSDITIFSKESSQKIKKFVEGGGFVLMAGGVTCFGSTDHEIGRAGGSAKDRLYIGFESHPLKEILPVDFSEHSLTAASEDAVVKKGSESFGLAENLDINTWPVKAYHKTSLVEGAEALVVLKDGKNDFPLLAVRQIGKGYSAAVTVSAGGACLFSKKPEFLWPDEAVLMDRLLRFGTGLTKDGEVEKSVRRQLVKNYGAPSRLPHRIIMEEFPYMTQIASPIGHLFPETILEEGLALYREAGFNRLVLQGTPFHRPDHEENAKKMMKAWNDAAVKYNLKSYLHPEPGQAARHSKKYSPEEYAMVAEPGGEFALWYGNPFPDPTSPVMREEANKEMKRAVSWTDKGWESFVGIYPDDEYAWFTGYLNPYQKGGPAIGSYSPFAKKYFKEQTGNDAPLPTPRKAGYVIPEDDPFLEWIEVMAQNTYEEYNAELFSIVREKFPEWEMASYPGGFSGVTGTLMEELYLDCWKESALESFERLDTRQNFLEDYSGEEHKMIALIGIFRMPEDKAIYPETLRLTVGTSLGRGVDAINLWHSANLWMDSHRHPGRDKLWNEASRIGSHLKVYGQMYQNLEKIINPVGVLSGWFWQNSWDIFHHLPYQSWDGGPEDDKEWTWFNFQTSDVFVPAVLRAGVPADFITEKQLLDYDHLKKRKAIFLPGLMYFREAALNNIEKYIKEGGKVYTDSYSRVKIEGAEVLDVDLHSWHYMIAQGKRPVAQPNEKQYREQRAVREGFVKKAMDVFSETITEYVSPEITVNDPWGFASELRNGDTRYIFVYNANTDERRSFDVTMKGIDGTVYDLFEKKEVGSGDINKNVTLDPGDWKVFVAVPHKLETFSAGAVVADGKVTVKGKSLSQEGRSVSGAFPVKITFFRNGRSESQAFYASTDNGILNKEIPIEHSVFEPEEVEVECLMTGKIYKAL